METQNPFHPLISLAISLIARACVTGRLGLENGVSTGQTGIRRQNLAFMGDSRAFACKTGVERPKTPFHPLILLKICSRQQVTSRESLPTLPITENRTPLYRDRGGVCRGGFSYKIWGWKRSVSLTPPRSSLPPSPPCSA
jgi:hypothetical protein